MDPALSILRTVGKGDISFQWFRSMLKADSGLKDTLNRGHAVIDTVSQLNQYLYTYGPMIESQWRSIGHLLEIIKAPDFIIDYGCGQGLAGILVNDLTRGRLLSEVRNVLLIEPSAPALARAAAVYERINPTATVSGICKRFDDVEEADMPDVKPRRTLHLFSNALDVPGFDPLELLATTLYDGSNTILSVSHDRAFNGGTPKIERVKAAFEDPANASWLHIHQSMLYHFTCDNPGQSRGVAWLCDFEVKNG